MLISPADAMHARDRILQALFTSFHPLALTQVFCSRSVFRDFACHVLRDLRHPLHPTWPTDDPGCQETETWFRQRLAQALTQMVQAAGLNVDECLDPPMPTGRDSLTYCPRCQGEYLLAKGSCHLCGGIPLAPLGPSQAEPPQAPEPTKPDPQPRETPRRKKKPRRRGPRRR